jgi:hypothetical protein
VAESRVVEDDPLRRAGRVEKLIREVAKECSVVCGIVGARRAVESPVAEAGPTAWRFGERRTLGRVGGDACDLETAQQSVDRRREPAGMAWLQRDEAGVQVLWMELANCGEELLRERFVERELGRKLDEERAEFVAEAAHFLEELV